MRAQPHQLPVPVVRHLRQRQRRGLGPRPRLPGTNGTETTQWTLGGYPVNGLFGALEFTGYGSATASVDRVSVTGTAYTVPTAVPNSIEGLGFNVVNGIVFDGYYPTLRSRA